MSIRERIKKFLNKVNNAVMSIYFAYQDPRTPRYLKVISFVLIAYVFSPLDLIPDFIPILGQLDDFILIPLVVFLLIKLLPKEVYQEAKKKVETTDEREKPKMWQGIVIITAIWVLIGIMIALSILKHYFRI